MYLKFVNNAVDIIISFICFIKIIWEENSKVKFKIYATQSSGPGKLAEHAWQVFVICMV